MSQRLRLQVVEENLVAILPPGGSAPQGLQAGRAPRATELQVLDRQQGCIRGRERHQVQGRGVTSASSAPDESLQQAWPSEPSPSLATLPPANPARPLPCPKAMHLCGQCG